MQAIEIARGMAALGDTEKAVEAYSLVLYGHNADDPAQEMEAALYILQSGENYKLAYTGFMNLYNRGLFRQDCLSIMRTAFYEPNVKDRQTRYERNCKLLSRYPYLFRKDFPAFEDLPIQFYPFDDRHFIPFYPAEGRFGETLSFNNQAITRNFFKDLDKPILAEAVFSQYELEYLNDNVRASEHIGMENHIYLHYPEWDVFCAYLQCLNMRPLLEDRKFVFLIGDELSQYPIDFKERFGIDYSQYPVKPLGIRDFSRLIWQTQLAAHNGVNFFNEIMDGHPNLLSMPAIMFDKVQESVEKDKKTMSECRSLREAVKRMSNWKGRIVEELYLLRNRTDKDILVAMFMSQNLDSTSLNAPSRIVPALLFQPHFPNIVYSLHRNENGRVTLSSNQYENIRTSPLFRYFKYIKTFTPLRRPTTSYAATVKFANNSVQEKSTENTRAVLADLISIQLLNRSIMIDWQDRLFKDSVVVRFEDGKLNPKATFTALASFLDIPYTESMTYCSRRGERDPESLKGDERGFSTKALYSTYDEYANDAERYFLEYFLRDVYEYYGYDFHYYDGVPMNREKVCELVEKFDTINHYIAESWRGPQKDDPKALKDEAAAGAEHKKEESFQAMIDNTLQRMRNSRIRNAWLLLENPMLINKRGQPLRMMPKLELDPALLEQPPYR